MSSFDFDTPLDRTGTYCTQWDYVQDRFGKEGLLPFTISDMDFGAPDEIIHALQTRLTHPVLGYSRWNHDDFKNAVVHWFAQRFDCTFDPQQLVYGPSVIYIIAKLIEKWSDCGDGIVFQTPAYDAFKKMINGAKRRCIESPLLKTSNGWDINWSELEALFSAQKPRIFLLCSPHNPTGRVWRKEELEQIARLCDKYDVALISDEIHMDISFTPHTPWQGFAMKNHWALVSSASKSFNIPALTGAYAFIADEKAREEYLFKLKEVDGLSSPSLMAVIATIAAYQQGIPWLTQLKEYIYQNHQLVQTRLQQAFPCLSYLIPQATYLAWIDLSALNLDMDKLQRDLIDHFNVAIMDGRVYGEQGRGFVRLNLGCPRTKVSAGLDALIKAALLQKSPVAS